MIPYTNMAMLPEAKVYLIANSVLVFVTLLVVALRVVSRVLAGSKLGWDDYFTLLAVPQGIVMLVLQGLCKSHDIVCVSMNIHLNYVLGTAAGLGYQLAEIGDNWTFVDSVSLCFITSTLSLAF